MGKTENRRRRYLVNKRLQLELSSLLVLLAAIPIIVLGSALYIVNKMYLGTLQNIVGETAFPTDYIQSILNFSVASVAGALIVTTILLIFIGIRFSHHIAGPLYRLQEKVEKLAGGEKIELLRFRRSDIISDLAAGLNTIIEKLRQVK